MVRAKTASRNIAFKAGKMGEAAFEAQTAFEVEDIQVCITFHSTTRALRNDHVR